MRSPETRAARRCARRSAAWWGRSSLRDGLHPALSSARRCPQGLLDRTRANTHALQGKALRKLVPGPAVWSPPLLILCADEADRERLRHAIAAAPANIRTWCADSWRCGLVLPGEGPRLLGISCLRSMVGDDDRLGRDDSVLVPPWVVGGMSQLCLNMHYRYHGREISGDLQSDLLLVWLNRAGLSPVRLPTIDAVLKPMPEQSPAIVNLFALHLNQLLLANDPYSCLATALVRNLRTTSAAKLPTAVGCASAQQTPGSVALAHRSEVGLPHPAAEHPRAGPGHDDRPAPVAPVRGLHHRRTTHARRRGALGGFRDQRGHPASAATSQAKRALDRRFLAPAPGAHPGSRPAARLRASRVARRPHRRAMDPGLDRACWPRMRRRQAVGVILVRRNRRLKNAWSSMPALRAISPTGSSVVLSAVQACSIQSRCR